MPLWSTHEVNDQKFWYVFHLNQSLDFKKIGTFAKDGIPMRLDSTDKYVSRYDISSCHKIFSLSLQQNHLRTEDVA